MREKGIDKYANAQTTICTQYTNNNIVTTESSRKPEHEHSTSRTFVILFVCKENIRGLQISAINIYQPVVSAYAYISREEYRISNYHCSYCCICYCCIKSLIEIEHIFVLTLFAINEFIF